MSAEQIIKTARAYVGKDYKPGISAMCADFVSTVISEAGYSNIKSTAWVPDMSDEEGPGGKGWGVRVSRLADVLPGDILLFDRTYLDATLTHVGICSAVGKMIHRPTMSGPVVEVLLNEYWSSRFNQGRRIWAKQEDLAGRLQLSCHSGKLSFRVLEDVALRKGQVFSVNLPETEIKLKV